MYATRVIYFFTVIVSVLSLGFTGTIVGFPEPLDELYVKKDVPVVNGANYPGKFNVELYKYSNETEVSAPITALVDRTYQFRFEDLSEGQYELLVNSYDFDLRANRYTITIAAVNGSDSGPIVALAVARPSVASNETLAVQISHQKPLQVEIVQLKQFYQMNSGSVWDLIMSSPLGFIFKSKLYSFVFALSLGVIIAPYLANWISPELVEQYKDLQQELTQEKAAKLKLSNQEEIDATLKARTAPSENKGLRKRK